MRLRELKKTFDRNFKFSNHYTKLYLNIRLSTKEKIFEELETKIYSIVRSGIFDSIGSNIEASVWQALKQAIRNNKRKRR